MTTTVQDHPAARATHALLEAIYAIQADDPDRAVGIIERAIEDVAASYQSYDDVLATNARLLAANIKRDSDLLAMEALDTKRVLMIADLKTRLARAAENNEELYRLTSHAVGDATERHLIVSRNRALLDLEIPLPPVKTVAITTPTHYGAPRAAASH